MKKDGEDSSYLPKVLDHDKALPDSDPISHQDFNNFAFVLSPKGKRVIGIIKRSIQHIRMPSSRHQQKAWKYTLITVCLPKSLIRFTMKYQSATPIKVLCNTSGFCFWAYPAWSSPAYWRQVVAVHNAQRHRIQSSFPRMLQSPAVF